MIRLVDGLVANYDKFQQEVFDALYVLVIIGASKKGGTDGVLDIKGMGITLNGEPIASVKTDRGGILFVTDKGELHGFFSESLEDMCRLYDDIAEVLE